MLSTEYLAGLFDGEGCVHIAHQNPNKPLGRLSPTFGLRVIYCLTHEEVIRQISEQLGYGYCKLRKNNARWKDAFQVQICGARAGAFLRSIYPYLIVKREEVELALKLQDHVTKYRYTWQRMPSEQKLALIAYRQAIKDQIQALRRSGASDGMTTNSGELPCPASDGAEGQSRAKLRSV